MIRLDLAWAHNFGVLRPTFWPPKADMDIWGWSPLGHDFILQVPSVHDRLLRLDRFLGQLSIEPRISVWLLF